MILQALVAHYEDLARRGEVARPGWGPAKVSFALRISDAGALLQVLPLKTEQTQGKKTVLAPQVLQVPMPAKRTVAVVPNFLCDNGGYVLGIDAKGKPQRTRQCFEACRDLHLELLAGIDVPPARALCAFFSTWDPADADSHPALQECLEEIKAGVNLVFWYGDGYIHDDPAVRAAWQAHYDSAGEGPELACLVTGRRGPAAILHPALKGVRGAQATGASLVSFNAASLESYGHSQGLNAPVSEYAAFAYGAALNHLLADREHTQMIGDTTVVFWAEGGEPAYQGLASLAIFGGAEEADFGDKELKSTLSALAAGRSVSYQDVSLDPKTHFYVLGLAPNAARVSVRFFLRDTFGSIMEHMLAHHDRLEIVRPSFDKRESLSLWQLLSETVNQKATDKTPSPDMAGEVLRSVLTGGRYPATLLNAAMLRIRAEHEVTRGRAAIIKAYYLRNEDPECPKEVLTVGLNEESRNIPYTLGRLFSVLEAVQLSANPGINATIKDKYFNSAASIPATIFPLLMNLAQKHLRKLDPGMRVYYEKQIGPLTDLLGERYPTRLSLPEQGSFQLGYYQQTQARYAGKK